MKWILPGRTECSSIGVTSRRQAGRIDPGAGRRYRKPDDWIASSIASHEQKSDIPDDPYEQTDLSASDPARTRTLINQLKSWLRQNVKPQYFPVRNPAYDSTKDPRPKFADLWE
jgi:hypothetical protein